MKKIFSQHCENNKNYIKDVLVKTFENCHHVLEIGSGTGQHAVFFAQHLSHLTWQTSDQEEYIPALKLQLIESYVSNVVSPLVLDVTEPWAVNHIQLIDGIFTANSFHIMSEEMVKAFFKGVGEHLIKGGQLCIYGPFNYKGQYSSKSNEAFDKRLKETNVLSGIRDFDWICSLALEQGLSFSDDFEMPANNRILHFSMI